MTAQAGAALLPAVRGRVAANEVDLVHDDRGIRAVVLLHLPAAVAVAVALALAVTAQGDALASTSIPFSA